MKLCRLHGKENCEDADCWERQNGAAQPAIYMPIEHSAERCADALERIATVFERVSDILRGRDGKDKVVPSPFAAIAAAITKIASPSQTTPPATQRTPQPNAVAPPPQPQQTAPAPRTDKRVATDSQLDGPHGDGTIRFDPRGWKGVSYKGQRMSLCDPAFLDLYADALDEMAARAKAKVDAGTATDQEKKNAQYNPLDAAKARGWGVRNLRAGFVAPKPADIDYDQSLL